MIKCTVLSTIGVVYGLSGLLLLRRVGRKEMYGVLVILPGEEKEGVGGLQYHLLLQGHNRDQLADVIWVDQVNYQTAASAPPTMA